MIINFGKKYQATNNKCNESTKTTNIDQNRKIYNITNYIKEKRTLGDSQRRKAKDVMERRVFI